MPPPDSLRRDDPPALRKSFSTLPAEIQQMIWSEAIAGLSCHHFKLKKDIDSTSSGHWVVHLKEKPKHQDASAYREWKRLWQVRNKAFVAAFRFYHRRKKIQPVNIFKPRKSPTYWPTAAISFSTDLVILSLERGVDKTNFTWFEHMAPFARSSMNFSVISSRLQHFGRVAIHYKHGAIGAKHDGIFTCYCPPGAGGCKDFNACAHELACFLDCFKKLEAFYFVLDPSLVPQQDFGTDFKSRSSARPNLFTDLTSSRRKSQKQRIQGPHLETRGRNDCQGSNRTSSLFRYHGGLPRAPEAEHDGCPWNGQT